MKTLKIQATDELPMVNFDPYLAKFELKGAFLSENVAPFFEKIIDWVKAYKKQPLSESIFEFELTFINTAASKMLLDFFSLLEQVPKVKIIVNGEDGSFEEGADLLVEI